MWVPKCLFHSINSEGAALFMMNSRENLNQCGLTGPIFPEKRAYLTCAHRQVNIVEYHSATERFCKTCNLEQVTHEIPCGQSARSQ